MILAKLAIETYAEESKVYSVKKKVTSRVIEPRTPLAAHLVLHSHARII